LKSPKQKENLRPYFDQGHPLFTRTLAILLLLIPGTGAFAKPWVDASVFSMNEAQLKNVFPDLRKVNTPRIAPRGLRSQWRLEGIQVAGHTFETILYAKNGGLQRIEHVWSATGAPCLARAVYEDVVADLNAELGPFQASDTNPGEPNDQRSAVWVPEGTDLIAYLHEANMRCTVRLVNKPHIAPDASEL